MLLSSLDLAISRNLETSLDKPHDKISLLHRTNNFLGSLDVQVPPLPHHPLSAVAQWCSYTVPVDTSINSCPKAITPSATRSSYHEMITKYPDFCRIFTHGSKYNFGMGGVGCSIVLKTILHRTLYQRSSQYILWTLCNQVSNISMVMGNLNNNFLTCIDALSTLKSLGKI